MPNFGQAFSRLDLFVEQQMRADNTPGVAVALTGREGLLRVSTHGHADLAAQIPVGSGTLFEIGSISKSFTAIALLQLHEAGQVDLHAPVARYLSWFDVPTRYEPITPHHLLSHTAGITMGTEFSTESCYEVWALREMEATAPPGTFFHYSNVGYKVLGLILEEVLGQSYGEIIQERILDPLGMASTQPVITHETRKRLAVGYKPFYDDRPAHPSHPLVPATWLETATADGSIAATAADMATYLQMLIDRGRGPGRRLISEESFRLMTKLVIALPITDEPEGFYGYGLDITEVDGSTIIAHGGGMVGYQAFIRADLHNGLGVVVLINGPGDPGQMARYGLRLLHAAHHGQEMPTLPEVPQPALVENAADYAGSYRSGDRIFVLVAQGDRLVLDDGGEGSALEKRGEDRFYVPHPDFSRFLLRFGRDEGDVVEAFHGSDWYKNDRYAGPREFNPPAEWSAYPGHYRAHNPWDTNFRVVLRKGMLVLIEPWGDEQVLVSLGDGVFRVGDEGRSPERIRFDTLLKGQAIRANLSGCDYYRTFTP